MKTSIITWHPASEPPDDGCTVLIATDEDEIELAYVDDQEWCNQYTQEVIRGVAWWAHVPDIYHAR